MIELTKLNDEKVVINSSQIEYVETIPESKIVMLNGKYHIVKEPLDEIINKAVDYNRCIFSQYRK